MPSQAALRSNAEDLPWVIQKYGGTSVGKFLSEISTNIVQTYMNTNRVIVVCSARSGETKAKGTTNRLLRAAAEALSPNSTEHLQIVKDLLEDHLKAAREIIQDRTILETLERQIEKDCIRLKSFLEAAQIIEEISPRSKDIIIGVGENLSCRIVAAALRDRGIDAEFVSLSNIIEGDASTLLDQPFYDHLASRMAKVIAKVGNKVPVVTGFFGNVPGSLLSTIGRGYTDLCAALLAVGLKAQELQIWKEVDGIFTADPRKVEGARLLPIITPEEAAELTYYGSEVIHPFTMEQVIRASIPIRIKNVENPKGQGTIIFPDLAASNGYATPPPAPEVLAQNGYHLDLTRKHPTAVTVKDNVCVLNIHSNRKNVSHGFLAKIFTILDRFNIIVDLISTSEVHVSMALGADIVESTLESAQSELEKLGRVDVLYNMAILSLVGKQMKNMVGISGKMFSTLAESNVNIEMISQGASEINISCVIDEKMALTAMNAIHKLLLKAPPAMVVPLETAL
ncbi:Aspartate/glutamate/uridylate kinase [Umbelopsis sp. PMI_123]|nr:Aspartate/glutamate/uridylate kinase [Umbelopsis sp. PMI_123]